jgi:flagellar biogenesis protein FliO
MQFSKANLSRDDMSWSKTPVRSFANSVQECIAAIVGRLHSGRGARRMELIEKLELGGKRQLMLVICDGHQYIVAAGSDSIQAITEIRVGAGKESILAQDRSCPS